VPNYSWADTLIFNANLDAALAEYFDQLRRDREMAAINSEKDM
jgi:hypothetical protein